MDRLQQLQFHSPDEVERTQEADVCSQSEQNSGFVKGLTGPLSSMTDMSHDT